MQRLGTSVLHCSAGDNGGEVRAKQRADHTADAGREFIATFFWASLASLFGWHFGVSGVSRAPPRTHGPNEGRGAAASPFPPLIPAPKIKNYVVGAAQLQFGELAAVPTANSETHFYLSSQLLLSTSFSCAARRKPNSDHARRPPPQCIVFFLIRKARKHR